MKRNLFALALVLFSGSLLCASAQTSPGKPQPTGSSLIISEYGTLVDVLNADGKSRFGKLDQDGYRVSYITNGKTKSVFAIGATQVKGLRPGQVKVNGRSASVTVTTDDNALEVTSYFILDEAAKKLTISRRFRNTSDQSLSLGMTRQYLDPKLLVGAGAVSKHADLVKVVNGRINAGRTDDDCDEHECPVPPPPCPPPLNCPDPRPSMTTAISEIGPQISLRWNPRTLTKRLGDVTQPANESNFVTQVSME